MKIKNKMLKLKIQKAQYTMIMICLLQKYQKMQACSAKLLKNQKSEHSYTFEIIKKN